MLYVKSKFWAESQTVQLKDKFTDKRKLCSYDKLIDKESEQMYNQGANVKKIVDLAFYN